jgi:hypothetical protein
MKHLLFSLAAALLILFAPRISAQENTPISLDDLAVITPENANTLEIIATFDHFTSPVAHITPDSATLAVGFFCEVSYFEGCDNRSERLWIYSVEDYLTDPSTKPIVIPTESADSGFSLSPDGRYVALCKEVGVMSLWEVPTQTQLPEMPGHYCARFNADSSDFLDSWVDPSYSPPIPVLYNIESGEMTPLSQENEAPLGFLDQDTVVLGERSEDFMQISAARLIDLNTQQEIGQVALDADDAVLGAGTGMIGVLRRLHVDTVEFTFDQVVVLVSLETGEELLLSNREGLSTETHYYGTRMRFNPSGTLFALAETDLLRLYDTTTGLDMWGYALSSRPTALALSDKLLVIATRGGSLQIWGVRR